MVDKTRLHYQEELGRVEVRALEGLDMVSQSLERTLEAVGCTPWFGWRSSVEPPMGTCRATYLTPSPLPRSGRCEKLDHFLHE